MGEAASMLQPFGAMHEDSALPKFAEHLTLRSQLPRALEDVTLVTQCSIDRLPALERQADSWRGVLSAVILWIPPDVEGPQQQATTSRGTLKQSVTALKALHR